MSVCNDSGLGMAIFVCERCESRFVEDQIPRRGSICFKCHINTVSIGFSAGKEDFHGPTIRERQNKTIQEANASGRTIEPAGSRWV